MTAFAAKHDLLYLPLAEHMRQVYQQSGKVMHIAGEGHYSQLGHQEVAHVLEQYVQDRHLIP